MRLCLRTRVGSARRWFESATQACLWRQSMSALTEAERPQLNELAKSASPWFLGGATPEAMRQQFAGIDTSRKNEKSTNPHLSVCLLLA